MTQGREADAAEQWLYTTLAGDSTLTGLVTGVYMDLAPEGAAFPLVILQEMSGVDLMEVASIRIWTNLVYLVKVIGQTASYADLKPAFSRIDVLLHRGSGTVTDGTVYACVRQSVVRLLESAPGGQQYRHSGGLYRVYAT